MSQPPENKSEKCSNCSHKIPPPRPETESFYGDEWFCSEVCARKDFLHTSGVPISYWNFDPQKAGCLAEVRTQYEKALKYQAHGALIGLPILLMYSQKSRRLKTRIAAKVYGDYGADNWKGWKFHAWETGDDCDYQASWPGLWLNAFAFRQKYLQVTGKDKSDDRQQWIYRLCTCDLLVADDWDKIEKPTAAIKEVLHSVFEERTAHGRKTVVTLNTASADLSDLWSPYILARIRESALALNFD
jgi:hypothetical protein